MKQAGKRRSFTAEMFFWIFMLVGIPLFVLSYYFYSHVTAGLKEMEREKSVQANQTAMKSIGKLGDTILGVTITNAYWDDNRTALLKRDMEWLDQNISDMPRVVPYIDFVAESDLQGNIVLQTGDLKEFTGKIGFPEILERYRTEKKFTAVADTSRGLALIAVSQVTGDEGQGEAAGLLMTGRFLTDAILQELSGTLQTDIGLLLQSGQFLASTGSLGAERLEPYLRDAMNGGETSFSLDQHKRVYAAKSAAPFQDLSGRTIGVLYTEMPSISTTQTTAALRTLSLITVGILTLLLLLVVYLLRRRIILPLRHFTLTMEKVASGEDMEDIPKHMLQAEAQILGAVRQIMQWNRKLEQTVEQRTAALRNLLDNARQGFLTIGPDLLVGEEYSRECAKLFGREIAGVRFTELLYPETAEASPAAEPSDSSRTRELLQSILEEFFRETDDAKRELIFSLLPEEAQLGELSVNLEYKVINDVARGRQIMAMLTDVTDKRLLESRVEREREALSSVVQAVTHPEDFGDVVRDFEAFCSSGVGDLLAGGGAPQQMMRKLKRSVHTFKGSFGFLKFRHASLKLHELESQLEEMLRSGSAIGRADLEALGRLLASEDWLREDRELLDGILGEAYFDSRRGSVISIDRGRWIAMENELAARLAADEDRTLLAEFRRWRSRPLGALVRSFPGYLDSLAGRLGVLVRPVQIRGGEIPVDADRYQSFVRSLMHVLRNIPVHGIETPEERLNGGKDEYGNVSFTVECSAGLLRIVITDDGRGIDADAVRERAVAQGICDPAEAGSLTDEQAVDLIFRDDFSTSVEVTDLSGRGAGLAAVRAETERLGGMVRVRTERGKGTAFVFELPYEEWTFDGLEETA